MSAHPHPGKRTPWRYVLESPPTIEGEYESRCKTDQQEYIFVLHLGLHNDWLCPNCEWRGLAEKPEEKQ